MRKLFLLLLSCPIVINIIGQSSTTFHLDSLLRYVDFHIHPTYKHYFRDRTAKTMKMILAGSSYDPNKDAFDISADVREKLHNDDWTRNKKRTLYKSKRAQRMGLTSHIRNYDQAGYPEIMFVPGSILCNSYSPFEKQFTFMYFKRQINSKVVTKMGYRRLTSYNKDCHTPFHDFMAEYMYNYMQQEEKSISTTSPSALYGSRTGGYNQDPVYHNAIVMVRDSIQLDSILKNNDDVFRHWKPGDPTPQIITPLVMSIEGGQVLYNTLSAKHDYILNPLNHKPEKPGKKKETLFFTPVSKDTLTMIHDELLSIVDSLRNLHHRLFFITLGHFAENHVVGFAKTLDRDPENLQHRAISSLSAFPSQRENFNKKFYSGFNMGINMNDDSFTPDSIGFKIVEAFLDPAPKNARFKKSTYIDVKHMDVQARIQYYYMRRGYEKKFNIKIPIIASHFGVSGETQAMAAATGLWPFNDDYWEIEDPEAFYEYEILRKERKKDSHEFWAKDIMGDTAITSKRNAKYYTDSILDPFDRAMYRPLDFTDPGILTNNKAYDPFENYSLNPDKVGWFYPWSINLFDEEIIEINKSDGIIGLLMDPRQLGAFMPKYKGIDTWFDVTFKKWKESLDTGELKRYGLTEGDLVRTEYLKLEPLLRNLFYIVDLVFKRQKEEAFFKACNGNMDEMRKIYPNYIPDSVYTEKNAWELVSIGSDYDGLIDPIDPAPTASYIPLLRRRMIAYAWFFALRHHDVFKDPFNNNEPFITGLEDSNKKMNKFFYQNGQNFIRKYF